ncbi:MAG: anti-sigma factor family protein [Fidelibacterota bacterium]
MNNHKKNLLKLLEQQLGQDIDADLFREVAQHMEECPDCKIYVDSVKQTINLYRSTENEQAIPDDVSDRLYKTLQLTTK